MAVKNNLPKLGIAKRGLAFIQALSTLTVQMKLKLTIGEIATLRTLVENRHGRGGFQNLLLHVWYRLDETTGEVLLPELLLERINRYAFSYGNSDWRRNLRKIFRRTLGANLDRGLRLI